MAVYEKVRCLLRRSVLRAKKRKSMEEAKCRIIRAFQNTNK